MWGQRKIFECKITVEGIHIQNAKISEPFIKDGYEVIERPVEFDSYRNCIKAEFEVYRIINPN